MNSITENIQTVNPPILDFLGEDEVTLPDGSPRGMRKPSGRPLTDEERMEMCGHKYPRLDPHTGKMAPRALFCHLPNCPKCREHRIAEARAHLVGYAEVKVVTLSAEEDRAYAKKYGRGGHEDKRISRHPTADGKVTFLLPPDVEDDGQIVATQDLDWNYLTSTPKGMRMRFYASGASPAKTQEDDGPSLTITVDAPVIAPEKVITEEAVAAICQLTGRRNLDMSVDEVLQAAWDVATFRTSHLSPDLETIQLSANARMVDFQRVLHEWYIPVAAYVPIRLKVYEANLNWEPYNEEIIAKFAACGFYAAHLPGTWQIDATEPLTPDQLRELAADVDPVCGF